MKPKTKGTIKVYDWLALAKLVVADMRREDSSVRIDNVHIIAGLDCHKNIFLRADTRPPAGLPPYPDDAMID